MTTRGQNTKLKRERELRGWSQKKLGELVGTGPEALSRWERGEHKPDRYYQEKLCELFGKTAEELGFIQEPTETLESSSIPTDTYVLSAISHQLVKLSDPAIPVFYPSIDSSAWLELSVRMLLPYFEETIRQYEDMSLLDNTKEPISRRSVLALLSKISLTLLGLSFTTPKKHFYIEEVTSHCATGISSCWELYFRGEVEAVEKVLPIYRYHLSSLVCRSSPLQKYIASLASHAYQLSCELATDREDYGEAYQTGQLALQYALLAEDKTLQVAALIRQATAYFHRKQSIYALRAFQQALPLLIDANVSPLLRGRVYAGLAEVLAMRGQEQEALRYMGLAHEHYPTDPERDPAYSFTHFTRYSLYVFGEGQTRLSLSQPKEASENFFYVEKNITAPLVEPIVRVDLSYYQATASVRLGQMDESTYHIQEAATLAKSIHSRLYYNKILSTYQELREKWGHERKVIELEEFFQPW